MQDDRRRLLEHDRTFERPLTGQKRIRGCDDSLALGKRPKVGPHTTCLAGVAIVFPIASVSD